MNMQRINLSVVFCLFILALGISFFINSMTGLKADAAAAPILVSGLSVILAGILLISEWKNSIRKTEKTSLANESDEPSTDLSQTPWWLFLIYTLLYFLLIVVIGFFPATFLYLLVVPYFLHYRNRKAIIISCLCFLLLYWGGFAMLIGVRFTPGLLFS